MDLEDVVIEGTFEIVNGVVNVNGNVDIAGKSLTEIPWKFGKVTGSFDCSHNKLISLENCPTSVGLIFDCSKNRLKSLQYCPIIVGIAFRCHKNELESLKYCPVSIENVFGCHYNRLTSLEYCPVSHKIICHNNPIKTFDGIPFNIISKIDCIHKYFSKKVTAIHQEYSEDFEMFMRSRKRYKQPRKISVEERLRSI